MSSRKRHLEETLEEPEIKNGDSPKNNDIFGQVQEFRTLLLSEEPVEKKKFKQFRRVLSDIKDNVGFTFFPFSKNFILGRVSKKGFKIN